MERMQDCFETLRTPEELGMALAHVLRVQQTCGSRAIALKRSAFSRLSATLRTQVVGAAQKNGKDQAKEQANNRRNNRQNNRGKTGERTGQIGGGKYAKCQGKSRPESRAVSRARKPCSVDLSI